MIKSLEELKELAHKAKEELGDGSAFEELLNVLVNYGMDEEHAAQLIANVIDEQMMLNDIAESFSNVYHDASEVIINNGIDYKA